VRITSLDDPSVSDTSFASFAIEPSRRISRVAFSSPTATLGDTIELHVEVTHGAGFPVGWPVTVQAVITLSGEQMHITLARDRETQPIQTTSTGTLLFTFPVTVENDSDGGVMTGTAAFLPSAGKVSAAPLLPCETCDASCHVLTAHIEEFYFVESAVGQGTYQVTLHMEVRYWAQSDGSFMVSIRRKDAFPCASTILATGGPSTTILFSPTDPVRGQLVIGNWLIDVTNTCPTGGQLLYGGSINEPVLAFRPRLDEEEAQLTLEAPPPPTVRITSPDQVTFSFVVSNVNGMNVAVPAEVQRQVGPIQVTATTTGPVNSNQIQWLVVGIDNASGDPPDPPNGAQASFTPNPTHPPYTPGGGRHDPAPGFGYVVRASIPGSEHTVTLQQHALIEIKDIIVQEYVNHNTVTDPRNGRILSADQIPGQNEIIPTQSTSNFSADVINQLHNYGAYNLIIGNPAQLAQAIRDEYNRRINDDVQVVPVGTMVQSANTVVVSPGQNVNSFGPILDTQPAGDDQVVGNTIVAGPNLRAETRANNNNGQPTNFPLNLTSAWRNPERNENVSGVIDSRHQFGDADDLQPPTGSVGGKTMAQLYCILETAAQRVVGVNNAFAERGPRQLPSCRGDADGLPSHVHAQRQ
jgi:hypothetical protein